jgi:DNA primase
MNEPNRNALEGDQPSTLEPLTTEDNLIARFLTDAEERGLVGEKENAATALLCAVSARLPRPLNLTVNGESSSGKNFLLSSATAFIPDEHKKSTSGLTAKALMHAREDEFQHKAIIIAEYEGVSSADYAIRTMQSEQVIEWDYVDTGKGIKKKTNKVRGPAAFLQATTRPVLHPENETRLLFISVDESNEQTEAILKRQARIAAANGVVLPNEESIKDWHEFLRSLIPMNICIPYAETLAEHFPADRVRSRRDFPKLLGLIETLAYLHQNRRENKNNAVIAAPDDYLVAKRLFENSYATGPDSKLTELLTAAQALKENSAFRASDLIEATGWGKSKVYAVLQRAEELGCIAETETRGIYSFIRSSAVPPLKLPDEV